MNFYEHHIGDYAEATAHLSFVEDAAYSRLIRKYYATERALPADLKTVQRLVGARTKEEREAVQAVLEEFFSLEEDGWHNVRCDEELARFAEKEPERAARRENDRKRQRRSRERRKALFDALRQHGIVPKFDASVTELEAALSRVSHAVTGKTVTRDNTASQSPVPSPQSPVPSPQIPVAISPQTSRITPNPGDTDHAHTAEKFMLIKHAYPKFTGRQDWITAQHACFQRIERDGCTWESLLEAAERYARYCSAGGVSGPQYVITPGKFFTDADQPWAQAWEPPPTKAALKPLRPIEDLEAEERARAGQ